MITRHVCPQMEPTAVEELTKNVTAAAREALLAMETSLLESFTSVGHKEHYMQLADIREEIAVLEIEAIIRLLHCPSCSKKGSNSCCPE
jgi:hypothetical protein